MNCSDKWVVQMLVDQCKAHGVRHWVFSPGSRNAPFAITVDADPFFKTTVIHDERSAAFFALGMAEKMKDPVALCCTSGSAPANYIPAVTEAFYRSIPLLIVTADRPSAWTDQGDGQTIRQKQLFTEFTHRSLHIEDQVEREDLKWFYQRESAFLFQQLFNNGPVHVNVGLREPLYQSIEKTCDYSRKILLHNTTKPSEKSIQHLASNLENNKIMVLCGQINNNHKLLYALGRFAESNNVVVLTENTSNLPSERFNSCIDRSLNGIPKERLSDYEPDYVISIGGAIVSKRIKSFLRNTRLKGHIKVGLEFPEMDTYQQLTESFACEPHLFLERLNESMSINTESTYYSLWKQIDFMAKDRMLEFKPKASSLTDMHVYQAFFNLIPEGSPIHMANSSVIRYCQLFDLIKGCEYYGNRGTSGIDGSMSTAMGFASQDHRTNYLIIGDVSFYYELNALGLKAQVPNLKILLINNQGGNIFSIIEGAKSASVREKYLEAKHQKNGEIAGLLGWRYKKVEDITNLEAAMQRFIYTAEIDCLEISTNPEVSPRTLTDFFTFVS